MHHDMLPDGEDLHRAIKWVSHHLQEDPARPLGPLVHEAVFKFDLSPRDTDFLIDFYRKAKEAGTPPVS